MIEKSERRLAATRTSLSWMWWRIRAVTALLVTLLPISTVVLLTGGCRINHPPERPTLSGPAYVRPGDTASFTVSTTDRDDDVVSYMFSWGDTSSVDWSPSYVSGQSVIRTHVYPDIGRYCVRVKARDSKSAESEWSDSLIVHVEPVQPNVPATPWGAVQWPRHCPFPCTTVTTDPESALVAYQFDWGDGTESQWSQFMDGGVPYADTHSYAELGPFDIKVRAKNSKVLSGWSAPLSVTVVPGEGNVAWSIGFTDPENIEDSADFSLNTFALDVDKTAYVACYYGALIARKPSGSTWKFVLPDLNQFTAAPVLADDGTICIGCTNDTIYALNADGTARWRFNAAGRVYATGAFGADGTAYFQTEDSMVVGINPDGSQFGSFATGGGNSAPVIGTDGTVYAATRDGLVYALDPSLSTTRWPNPYSVGSAPIVAAPALDPTHNALYVANRDGLLHSIDLSGTGNWTYAAGAQTSCPVVGPDGSIYIGGGGRLSAVRPDGQARWVFVPTMTGVVSTPALTTDGHIYVLVVHGKKNLALQGADSLYAVNSDGTRRWACGLGEGISDSDYPLSAPKVDASGFIYVGNGYRAWCVVGESAPAQSIWPMFQHDAQNSGRAR